MTRPAHIPQSNRRAGWILIETLVALMVLSIGILAVNRAMQEATLTRAMARDFTQARFLLEQVASELDLQPILIDGDTHQGDFGKDYPRFSYQWNVSRVDLPAPQLPPLAQAALTQPLQLPSSYLGKVTVKVSWTRAGRTFDRTLETLIAPEKMYTTENEQAVPPQILR